MLPRKNDVRIMVRYMIPMRLWSTVVIHDQTPFLAFR
jgi:hypothetical protein